MNDTACDLSWITPELAVGGSIAPAMVPRLRPELGITHVVDLRSEWQDDAQLLHAHGVEPLFLPTDDHAAIAEPMLVRGVAWVIEQRQAGGRVLLHCERGIGRSVQLAWCVLVALGTPPRAALEQIKRARWQASPSPAQITSLLAFARAYANVLPEWDELADIAYSHLRAPTAKRSS